MSDSEKLNVLWAELQEVHKRVYDDLAWISRQMKVAGSYSLQELTDIGFLCREMERLLDDWRKDCKARKELAGKLLAKGVLDSAEATDLEASLTVRGELATATPDVSMVAELPKAGTPEFVAYCEFYGIPKDKADNELFPLAIHWKRAQLDLQQRMERGLPQPPGLGKKFPHYFAIFTKLRSRRA